MINIPVPPWRRDFDCARDPYTARNALGITSTGGGGAPTGAEYITGSADATLTNERVLTNSATITWDLSTPGQVKANTAAGGGNVSNSGTPTSGQYAKWVTSTTIQGVAPATVLSDIGAQPAGSYQPLDADLTAIAALTGTNVIYYRSAADTWSPITIGARLTFSGGTLNATDQVTGVAQPLDATLTSLAAFNTNGLLTQTAADTFTGRTLTGPAAGITVSNGNGVSGNPTLALANDLAALEGLSGTNTIYYRSGTDAWSGVTIGSGLSFASGTLSATAGGAAVADIGVPQCGRLTYVSATALSFTPFNGDRIKINGTIYAIPSAGIAGLANTGVYVGGVAGQNLAANQTYYVYCFNNSGTLTADFRVAGHVTSATAGNVGVEVLTGPDDTRTLIGMIRTNTSSQFADSVSLRLVRSWFNRQRTIVQTDNFTNATSSTTWVGISLTAATFVIFAGEAFSFNFTGYLSNNTANAISSSGIGIDSVTVLSGYNAGHDYIANGTMPVNVRYSSLALSEGLHNAFCLGQVSSGSATWIGIGYGEIG